MANKIAPFPVQRLGDGYCRAKIDNVWKAAREYAEREGLKHNYATVEGVAPL